VAAGGGSQVTLLREEIDPSADFAASGAYPLWLEADIAPLILSARPVTEKCMSAIGIYRRPDQPLFNERESRIAHILLSEVSWLHATGWPEDFGARVPTLSPRCRLVLNLLLEGHSRKMVADKLEISIHTVSGYVKEIYRTFGVQSHAELLRRFSGGSEKGAGEAARADG
jgi:DNA-binding CsgD family transcriptional regulator